MTNTPDELERAVERQEKSYKMTTDEVVERLEPEERAVNILLDFDGSPVHACFPAGVMPFGLVSELIQKISDQEDALSSANARAKAAEEVLRELVQINEQHNAAVEKVIGRPVGWRDSYLDRGRALLAKLEVRG